MIPKDMRFSCHEGMRVVLTTGDVHRWVYDTDQRRWITVSERLYMGSPLLLDTSDDRFEEAWEEMGVRATKLVEENIDKVAAGVVGILVDGSGNLTFVNEHELDENKSTWYPLLEEYQLPEGAVKTVMRSELTELDRLSVHVDLVSRPGLEKCVFKYTHHYKGCGSTYQEFQIHARLPRHPNILPLDRLVLDEISGKRVVGFTTPYIAGGDLDTNKDRPFKLKYLKQLVEAVDHLNYKLGIVHHDMAPRNLFIDPSTDDVILFDFSVAAKIGYKTQPWERNATQELKERNDVKGVVMTLHEILTRDPCYAAYPPLHLLDETVLFAGPEKWVKHPDVELDAGLDAVDYYNELMRWVRARRERPITVYTEAAEPIDWPARFLERERPWSYTRDTAEEHNWPYIEWVRPRSAHLDRSRRLLATGKYADEAGGSGGGGGNKAEPAAWDEQQPTESSPEGKTGRERDTEPAAAATTTNPDPTTKQPPQRSNPTPPNPNTTKREQPETNNTTAKTNDKTTPVSKPRQAPKRPQPEATPPTSSSAPAAAAATTERETQKTRKTETKIRKRAGSAVLPEERGPVRRSPRLRARGRSMSPVVHLPN